MSAMPCHASTCPMPGCHRSTTYRVDWTIIRISNMASVATRTIQHRCDMQCFATPAGQYSRSTAAHPGVSTEFPPPPIPSNAQRSIRTDLVRHASMEWHGHCCHAQCESSAGKAYTSVRRETYRLQCGYHTAGSGHSAARLVACISTASVHLLLQMPHRIDTALDSVTHTRPIPSQTRDPCCSSVTKPGCPCAAQSIHPMPAVSGGQHHNTSLCPPLHCPSPIQPPNQTAQSTSVFPTHKLVAEQGTTLPA